MLHLRSVDVSSPVGVVESTYDKEDEGTMELVEWLARTQSFGLCKTMMRVPIW